MPPSKFQCVAMSGARMAGIEDVRVSAEQPDEHRVGRSWKGGALTLSALKAALAIENGERSRKFSQRRRAYFRLAWHSAPTGICERRSIANAPGRLPHRLSRCV